MRLMNAQVALVVLLVTTSACASWTQKNDKGGYCITRTDVSMNWYEADAYCKRTYSTSVGDVTFSNHEQWKELVQIIGDEHVWVGIGSMSGDQDDDDDDAWRKQYPFASLQGTQGTRSRLLLHEQGDAINTKLQAVVCPCDADNGYVYVY